ncbi:Trp biosynthesis-associated membrane protein [Nocardioides sp. Bht2]|uniref:Trp biosynthesis-associated membrane protein n=1 Tax=Nocardioides sp. Bht2 TaxID=3392297 RepID=UPI0039B60313
MSDRRRASFGPLVLLGLAAGALAAVSAGKDQVRIDQSDLDSLKLGTATIEMATDGTANLPLAQALALVALASWGVLLLTRGTFRRLVAVLAALGSVGVLVAAVVGMVGLREDFAADTVVKVGMPAEVADAFSVHITGWFWALLVGGLLCVVAGVLAVRLAPFWPEMGSRYDAPTGQGSANTGTAEIEEQSNLDLWKQLDEGRDPTE